MREVTIEIPIEEEEPLGAILDRKLIIVQVQANTLADGRIQIGDRVTKVKGIRVRDIKHFYQLLRYASPLLKLTVEREDEPPAIASSDEQAQPSVTSTAQAQAQLQLQLDLSAIPEERRKPIPRRSGFVYRIVDFGIKKGERLGLDICSYQNRVIVSNTVQESVSAKQLKRGDHIIDVNGTRVSEMSVASNFISQSLNESRMVSMLIARPATQETKQEMEDDIVRKIAPPPKVVPPDVKDLCAKERQRMKTESRDNVLPPIVAAPNTRLSKTVTFDDARSKVVEIPDDNPSKVLRPVKK